MSPMTKVWLVFTLVLAAMGIGTFFHEPPTEQQLSGSRFRVIVPPDAAPAEGVTHRLIEVEPDADGRLSEDLAARLERGVSEGLGFVLRIATPRPLTPEAAASLAEALGRSAGAVGPGAELIVLATDWRLLRLVRERTDRLNAAYATVEQPARDTLGRGDPGASPWLDGYDFDETPLSVPQAIARHGGGIWAPFYRDVLPPAIDEAHELGLEVIAWTVNDPADMKSLGELGVDGLVTDRPDQLAPLVRGGFR